MKKASDKLNITCIPSRLSIRRKRCAGASWCLPRARWRARVFYCTRSRTVSRTASPTRAAPSTSISPPPRARALGHIPAMIDHIPHNHGGGGGAARRLETGWQHRLVRAVARVGAVQQRHMAGLADEDPLAHHTRVMPLVLRNRDEQNASSHLVVLGRRQRLRSRTGVAGPNVMPSGATARPFSRMRAV